MLLIWNSGRAAKPYRSRNRRRYAEERRRRKFYNSHFMIYNFITPTLRCKLYDLQLFNSNFRIKMLWNLWRKTKIIISKIDIFEIKTWFLFFQFFPQIFSNFFAKKLVFFQIFFQIFFQFFFLLIFTNFSRNKSYHLENGHFWDPNLISSY